MIGISKEQEKEIVDAAVAFTLNHASNRPYSTTAEKVFELIRDRGLIIVENKTVAVSRP